MQEINTLGVIIIILFTVAIVFAFARCKMSCGGYREGMQSHRVPTVQLLEDDAYGVHDLSPYRLKGGWPLKLPRPQQSQKKENYTDVFMCNKKCGNIPNATPRAECMQQCMESTLGTTYMTKMNVLCKENGDCPGRDHVCVSPSYYGGGKHGYCMDTNEPGIPQFENFCYGEGINSGTGLREGCKPGYFFNESVRRCENRFQGSSSAIAVHMERPGLTPKISIPGTTTLAYGIGSVDPLNVPTPSRLRTDQ